MQLNIKKYGTIIIIAVLFAFFSFSIVDLVVQQPVYSDYCTDTAKPVPISRVTANCTDVPIPDSAKTACSRQDGYTDYKYDSSGCPQSYFCNTCSHEFDLAGQGYRKFGFIITGIFGVLAIMAGLYFRSKEEVVEWIFSGFLIGGILSVFIGTMTYFRDMGRFLKPVVLLIEMGLIIWIVLRMSKKQ